MYEYNLLFRIPVLKYMDPDTLTRNMAGLLSIKF